METYYCEVLIIGAGLAGLAAALAAQEESNQVLILCKGVPGATGSSFANLNGCWGLSAALDDRECERLETWIHRLSHKTNRPEMTRILVQESARALADCQRFGVRFLDERVVPCFYDQPLAVIVQSALQAGQALRCHLDASRVRFLTPVRADRLLIDDGRCVGALAWYRGGQVEIQARATVLATGGDGACFPANIVSKELTGDGYRMAAEVNLPLVNMAYRQWVWEDLGFHERRFPVAAFWSGQYRFVDSRGTAIDLDDLAARFRCSRAGHVPIANLQEDRRLDERLCRHLDPDGRPGPIEVIDTRTGAVCYRIRPHVQASNGGLPIGAHGQTALPGLYAAGEVTSGMHGGDRVGGLMVTNCLVFGRRAGAAAADFARQI